MGDIVNSVADLFGAGPASKAADATTAAANTAAAASNYATDLQKQMFDTQQANQKPWLQAGTNALSQLTGGMGTNGMNGPLTRNFSMSDYQQDPGYQFRLSEGLKALQNSAAARGGLLSGATLKGISRYGQDYASNEYQNAYNRYQSNQTNQFNRLASVAGLGQTANNALSVAGANFANNAGNIAMTNGANQGNALLARANISASQYGNLGSAINTAMNPQTWNSVRNAYNSIFTGGAGSMSGGGSVQGNSDYYYDL